ncbi:MAG: putative rane protein [bacterium]|nr:putative rane protein [bacterium]
MMMATAAGVLCLLVALEHFYFCVLECFLWNTPFGRRTFGTTPEFAASTAPMMANQGVYNAFLAAGLTLSLLRHDANGVLFVLGCVVLAGVVGAATVKRSILFLQSVPAALAMAAVVAAR